MSNAFVTGLGGLRANQSWLDIIGNNLANANTPGFKSSRAQFSDSLSRLLRSATEPVGQLGGTNPSQIGTGVRLSNVDRYFGQGALAVTGRTFDLAIVGRGFFGLEAPDNQTLYSRVGSFGLDASNVLVDQISGYKVLDSAGSNIQIPVLEIMPPSPTSQLSFSGNLPGVVTGPLAEVLTSSSTFVEGTSATLSGTGTTDLPIPLGQTWTMELIVDGGAPDTITMVGGAAPTTIADVAAAIDALDNISAVVGASGELVLSSKTNGLNSRIKVNPGTSGTDLASALGLPLNLVTGTETPATSATDLNALTANLASYVAGDLIQVSGTNADGTPILSTFEYGAAGDGSTLQDFTDFLSAQYSTATAAFNGTTGQITLTADTPGDSSLSLVIQDGAGQTGTTDWAQNAMAVTTNGAGPDTVATSMEIWDDAGVARLLSFTYERQVDGTWNLSTAMDPGEGVVLAGDVNGITFGSNGALATPTTADIQVQFAGQTPQTISLDLGTAGGFDGLTLFGSSNSVKISSQDGFGAGELASMQVRSDGTIEGFYTNGESQDLGVVGITTFANEKGLEDVGQNFWRETVNSGNKVLTQGLLGTAGEVIGGALEQSNVDTTEEFVLLIQAQRGFQASARIISTQDEILQEAINIV